MNKHNMMMARRTGSSRAELSEEEAFQCEMDAIAGYRVEGNPFDDDMTTMARRCSGLVVSDVRQIDNQQDSQRHPIVHGQNACEDEGRSQLPSRQEPVEQWEEKHKRVDDLKCEGPKADHQRNSCGRKSLPPRKVVSPR